MAKQPDSRPDNENPEWTAEEIATAVPFEKALPGLAASARRGRPAMAHPKKLVSLRIDQDVIDCFKAGGDGWQSRMNDALRKAAGLGNGS